MTTVVPETVSTPDRLADLSRVRAHQGDGRLALLAAWACDAHLLEALLWENGLGDAPDVDAQLAAVGDAVAAAITARADLLAGPLTPRQVLEVAREALLSTFDESVHALVTERLMTVEHLDVPAAPRASTDPHTSDAAGWSDDGDDSDLFTEVSELPDEDRPAGVGAASRDERAVLPDDEVALTRLGGRTAEHLVAELRATAADCMAVADLMRQEGQPAGALRLARQADAAAFEAYLTTAAVLAGDHALATVDLRWALARDLTLPDAPLEDEPVEDEPGNGGSGKGGSVGVADVVEGGRDLLLELVGSAERGALGRTFEPLDRG